MTVSALRVLGPFYCRGGLDGSLMSPSGSTSTNACSLCHNTQRQNKCLPLQISPRSQYATTVTAFCSKSSLTNNWRRPFSVPRFCHTDSSQQSPSAAEPTVPAHEGPSVIQLLASKDLQEMRAVVSKLYVVLNVEEYHRSREQELLTQLDSLKSELVPLEKIKEQLELQTDKLTTRLLWLGVSLMGVQFGFLARLTWWEYSWDIMEPVTYFTTYATVICGYAYYVFTRIQYEYPDAKDRMWLQIFYRAARKEGFDVKKYNSLKTKIYDLESELNTLRKETAISFALSRRSVADSTATNVSNSEPTTTESTPSTKA